MHKQTNDFDQNDKENLKIVLEITSTIKPKTQVITETARKVEIESEKTLSSKESTEKIINSIKNYDASAIETYKITTPSCTSSTDSGVNISDNDEIPPSPPPTVKRFNKQFHNKTDADKHVNENSNKNYIYNNVVDNKCCSNDDENYSTTLKTEQKNRMQQQKFIENLQTTDNYGLDADNRRLNFIINNEKVTNVSQQRNLPTVATTNNDSPSLQRNTYINQNKKSNSTPPSPSLLSVSSANSSEINPPSNVSNCNSSPVVSIRSICSSTIITSDSDSDSDINGDIEGVHENYVIKKLGTQVSYPPKHPAIPNINSGHTLINQQVHTVGDQQQLSPLAALAAVGDTFGKAQALGATPSVLCNPQRPQIGSIALSNSSDVTFGDKHFYEGPVTIQQFLIDNREKWKDHNGKDNPTFANDSLANNNNDTSVNAAPVKSDKLHEYISKRKRVFIPCILTVVALLIVGIIFAVQQSESKSKLILRNNEESRKNIPKKSTIDSYYGNNDDENCSGNGTLCFIKRDVWRAHPPKSTLDKQKLPLHRAIISHTASEPCNSVKTCSERVRVIQEFHMHSFGWDDIGYNFLISSDGRVYEGRGWDAIGAHTKGYNTGSVGITFIGTYVDVTATEAQLKACLALLDEGQRLNKLSDNYHVYGARQFSATESPGEMLYKQIKKWPRWSADINLN